LGQHNRDAPAITQAFIAPSFVAVKGEAVAADANLPVA